MPFPARPCRLSLSFFLLPFSFCLLLLLLPGCAILGVAASAMPPPTIQPRYTGLAGQKVGVMVWTDPGIRIDWPTLQIGTGEYAEGPTGVTVKFADPTPDGLEPVLFLTRRGDVVVAAVDPKDPFPKYHGQGGRLHRAGDTMPRISPVAKLAITHASP